MTFADVSPVVSVIALAVSLFTLWFSILRRGTARSTHPSFIAFRYDSGRAKIFLRTLLFSTGKRGLVIESLFLRVREGTRSEEFSFWGYGDKDLVRGSGLFVGDNGIVTNHHFNPINTEEFFKFTPGTYDLELVAKLIGTASLVKLSRITLSLPSGAFDFAPTPPVIHGRGSSSTDVTVFFNWSPEQASYIASIEKHVTRS
jgi:hypothetical protein